jgi:hypothetical protein
VRGELWQSAVDDAMLRYPGVDGLCVRGYILVRFTLLDIFFFLYCTPYFWLQSMDLLNNEPSRRLIYNRLHNLIQISLRPQG